MFMPLTRHMDRLRECWAAPHCLVEDQGISVEGGEEESDGLWTPVAFIALFLLSLLYSAGITLLKVR
ncbi:unnamed protein product [Lepidochelys olivacea]